MPPPAGATAAGARMGAAGAAPSGSEGADDGQDPPGEHTFSGAPSIDPVGSARAVIPDADEAKGFLASLFDFSFRSFVFPQIVQLVYLVGVVLISIGAIVAFLAMARNGATGFIAGLVVGAVGWFLGVVFFRILMEIYLVFFSIRDHVAAIDRRQR